MPLLLLPPWQYVYRSVVPTTEDLARFWMREYADPGSLVVLEKLEQPNPRWEGARELEERVLEVTRRMVQQRELPE